MSDRELLELAAKAAGIQLRPALGGAVFTRDIGDDVWQVWNPRDDDGDAFRLMVKLGLDIKFWDNAVIVETFDIEAGEELELSEELGDDPLAATRRAIVRAAAEIGRNMK